MPGWNFGYRGPSFTTSQWGIADGSGCDPWAGTSGLLWGGFGLERHPWGSPYSWNFVWKGTTGALLISGILFGKASLGLSPFLEFGLERHLWVSPHFWILVWRGVPGALPIPGIWLGKASLGFFPLWEFGLERNSWGSPLFWNFVWKGISGSLPTP